MANTDLSNVKRLIGAPDANGANRLIALGWVLLNTASGKDESGYPLVTYSLGWLGDDAPKY